MLELSFLARVRRAFRGGALRDGAVVFSSMMLVNALGYATHFILSRRLGVLEYGGFVSLLSAVAILSVPAAIATMIVVKMVAEFHALDERAKIRVLSLRVLTGCSVLMAAAIAAGALFRAEVSGYLHLSWSSEAIAAAVALGFGFVLPVIRGVLQGVQDFTAYAVSIFAEAAGKIALSVGLVYAGYGVVGAFAGYAAASLLSFGYTLWAVRKHWLNVPTRLAIDRRRLLITMGGATAAIAAMTLMGFVDLVMVKHFFSARDAGLYGAAAFCGKILLLVVGFVPAMMLPKAARSAAGGGNGNAVLAQGIGITAAFATVMLGVFFLFPNTVVRVTYGADYALAAQYIFRYGVAMSLLGMSNVLVNYAVGMHRFAVVWPLAAIAIAEPVAITFFHTTLNSVINVLLATNLAATVLCLIFEKWSAGSAAVRRRGVRVPSGNQGIGIAS